MKIRNHKCCIRERKKKDQIRAKSINDLEQPGQSEVIQIAGIPKTYEEDCHFFLHLESLVEEIINDAVSCTSTSRFPSQLSHLQKASWDHQSRVRHCNRAP